MAAPTEGQTPTLDQQVRSMILDNSQATKSSNAVTNQTDGLEAGSGRNRRQIGRGGRGVPVTSTSQRRTGRGTPSSVSVSHEWTRGGAATGSRNVQIQSRPDGYWTNHGTNGRASNASGVRNSNAARGGSGGRVSSSSAAQGRGMIPNPSTSASLQRSHQSFAQTVDTQCDYLEFLFKKEMPSMDMTAEEIAEKDAFRAHVQSCCQEAARKHINETFKLQLEAFGSYASTFGMPGSDMDLALIVSEVPAELPRLLERTLLDLGLGARLLTRTRVPIIKICEKPTPGLLTALREDRAKWDKMTPEEREDYDKGPQHDDGGEKKKDGAETKEDGAETKKKNRRSSKKDVSGEGKAVLTDVPTNTCSRPSSQPDANDANVDTISLLASNDDGAPQDPDTRKTRVPEQPGSSAQASHEQKPPQEDALAKSPKDAPHPRPRSQKVWLREKAPSPLDFPKSLVGIQADINFSTLLGLHNTALLRCYSAADPRVRPFILFIKRWASRRKINSSYNGTVSSYGFVLMALHVLVNVAKPPVCPNLQLVATHKIPANMPPNSPRVYTPPDPADPKATADACDIRFWRNEAELRNLASRGMLTHNRQPLGALLRLFFLYFGSQGPRAPFGGFSWMGEVLSLRTPGGILSKQEKGWTGARTVAQREDGGGSQVRHRFLFAVEDPFEWAHNVGRTVTHFGIVAVRDEFRRVGKVLDQVGRVGSEGSEGGVLDLLVEEVKEVVADGAEEGTERKETTAAVAEEAPVADLQAMKVEDEHSKSRAPSA